MKQFFKSMFASVLGVLIAMGVIILGGLALLMGIAASSGSSSTYVPKDNSVLKLSLKGSLSDTATENPFGSLMGEEDESLAVQDVVKAIRTAKVNEKIKGIYLDAVGVSGGFAGFEAIRRELADFKESGKFIVAYSDMYTQGCYYLASVADSVFVNPQGGAGLVGLASQGLFIKDLAAKLGIEYYIFKVGTYKSAVEPYFMDKFSDANREQLTSFLGSIWGNMTSAICESRHIQPDEMNRFLNEGLAMEDAQVLVDYKLVDGLRYRKEAEDCVKRMAGQDLKEKMVTSSVKNLLSVKQDKKEKENKIAVLYAEGSIQDDDNSFMSAGASIISEKMADELRKLADDEDVKAVVFRVNSPGGSAYISEQIWKAVTELKEEKPIVVSMGDYAASGGYYISCAANKIVAEKTTLTGSIGVFGVVRNMAGTAQKLGVKTDIVKTNTYADLGDMTRPMREDEKALIQHGVERTYDLFLTRCSDGRGMSKDSIDHIGQGRVWTGEQALERGLVDKLGGLDVAIEEAASLAGVTDYSVTKANTKKDFFTEYMEKALGEAKVSVVKSVLGEDFSIYSTLQQMKGNTGIQTRMPYLIQGL
ncbi:MAG TPA: signal peptide peptidase SppA [Candidatus Parabacteroides intestinavium]|nr:signal peptide peptidase SppA [Candidatus Parabacteroides intestinavium]